MEMPFAIAASVFIFCTYGLTGGFGQTGEYIYHLQKLTWNEARNVCLSNGGDLAKMDSQETLDNLVRLSREYYPNENLLSVDFWIGLVGRTPTRRKWVIDCSNLKFTRNYEDSYKDSELCFLIRPTNSFLGNQKACDLNQPFLCERHKVGPCNFKDTFRGVEAFDVNGVTVYQACEDTCADDNMCTGVLYVSPSTCYKLGNDSLNQTNQLATVSNKQCAQFIKNETMADVLPNNNKFPEVQCSILSNILSSSQTSVIIPTYSTFQPSATVPTSTIDSYLTPTPVCPTQVVTSVSTVSASCLSTSRSILISPSSTYTPDCSTRVSTVWATSTQVLTRVSTVPVTQVQTRVSTVPLTQILTRVSTVPLTQIMTIVSTVPLTQILTQVSTVPVTQVLTIVSAVPVTQILTRVSTVSASCLSTSTPIPEKVSKNLTINAKIMPFNRTFDAKLTSLRLRKLVSATDSRATSNAVGFIGMACILVPVALVVIADIKRVYEDIRNGPRKVKKRK